MGWGRALGLGVGCGVDGGRDRSADVGTRAVPRCCFFVVGGGGVWGGGGGDGGP